MCLWVYLFIMAGVVVLSSCDELEKSNQKANVCPCVNQAGDELDKTLLAEKRLRYVLPDGSFGDVFLEHKVNAMMPQERKINVTYYIVDHYDEALLHEGGEMPYRKAQSEAETLMHDRGLIIQLYDKNGNALVLPLNDGFRPYGLVYDTNLIKGETGWSVQWKGLLHENSLTSESFYDVDSVIARRIRKK